MPEASFAAGLVGIVLDGRYRLDALLGEGGMGAVFRATQLAMERKVAVKLLKPHLTNDDAALERFMREARSTLKVDSPHAVKVHDFGITPQRDYYMVLEYVDGRTVQRELDVDGPFAPARVVHIAQQALRGLGAAHAVGLVHRDIKPDNILLMTVGGDPDFAKVLDFGVAKLMEGAARTSQSALALTKSGMVFGTPEFMSPEQACGQQLDARSDLYSLAATMFAMLTGCGMYQAGSPIEWLTAHARKPPPHLAEGRAELAAYPQLDAALQRCLAKDRDRRPASAEDMIALLASVEASVAGSKPSQAKVDKALRATLFSPSTYIPALDPAATLLPGAEPSPAMSLGRISTPASKPTAAMSDAVALPPRRRGLWIALGALTVAGVIAAAIVVAATRHGAATKPPPPLERATKPVDAPPIDAAAADAAPADASPPPDAAPTRPPVRPNNDAARHLAAAEAARLAGNHLGQIAEADAALRADPHSVRARYLLADGLIATGDLDHGCKYLRDLGRNPAAVARARSAGCPSD